MIRKTFGAAAGAAMLLGLGTANADAVPFAAATGLSDIPAVTLVSGGCGPFGHRNYFGECRPGGGGFYGRPAYGYGYGGGYYGRRCFIRPGPFGPRRICR